MAKAKKTEKKEEKQSEPKGYRNSKGRPDPLFKK
jgi:hypothetical protein